MTSGKTRAMSAFETTTSWCSLPSRCTISRWNSVSSYSASSKRSEKVLKRRPSRAAQRRDDRAVEAARQVAADRDVGAQHPQAGGRLERGAHRVHRVVERAREALAGPAGYPGPGAGRGDRAAAIDADAAGLELGHAFEDRLRRHRRPEGERLVEADGIESALDGRIGGEDRLHLGGEDRRPACSQKTRPHAETDRGRAPAR